MNGGEEDTKANELLIIRRRPSGDDGGGKGGGVWKIAYADFMTAMMAFFLVMWLINSTDKKVLTQLANYFNPMRLTDKTPKTRGLHEDQPGAAETQQTSANSHEHDGKAKGNDKAEGGKPKYTEEMLFKDPYGVLSKLAVQAGGSRKRAEMASKNDVEAVGTGGEAYRDPFDPDFRRERMSSAAAAKEDRSDTAQKADAQKKLSTEVGVYEADPAQPGGAPGAVENAAVRSPSAQGAADKKSESDAARQATIAQSQQQALAEAEKVKAEIHKALETTPLGVLPGIDVTVTEDGTLISVMDEQNFGMFAIASAEPRPATVVIMEKIAAILVGRKERLVIRGHTDGRPYKSQNYDNWRLSTARAHMARYMLVRGGVAEQRFDSIEGHADRDLRVRDNPEAAQNRRIEILLRKSEQR